MTAQLIDGKTLASKIRQDVTTKIAARVEQGLKQPALAVILLGTDAASEIYVSNKRRACEEVGIKSVFHQLPAATLQAELITLIEQLNHDAAIDGILLQLPLPDHIDSLTVLESIHAHKDVDGFNPYNLGRLAQRRPFLRPCTPYGIIMLLNSIQLTFKKRHAVIVGASNIVGRPMALELLLAGCTITVCHRFTNNLADYVKQADILVAAAGKPHLVKGDWIKPDSVVIDVGINRLPNGTITGDVEFEIAREKAAWITPVPGGVGPMTVAVLMKNTLFATENQNKIL